MHVIARKTLVEFWGGHADSKSDLEAWFYEACNAHWKSPQDIKNKYSTASFLKDNRVVFNIHGNKFRLVVRVNYKSETVFILFVGTHSEYDKYNMEVVEYDS